MKRKTILHIIDSFSRMGGAEKILLSSIESLDNYNNILVCVQGEPFNKPLKNLSLSTSLNYNSWKDGIKGVIKLKKILKREKIDVIHSHLFLSIIIGRLVTPSSISFIASYHSLLYDKSNSEQYSRKRVLLDKTLLRKWHYSIFVSKAVEVNVSSAIGTSQNYILRNFVDDVFYDQKDFEIKGVCKKFVTIGNLRKQKNQILLLKSFELLKHLGISLDIYGEGEEEYTLQEYISNNNITNVKLLGSLSAKKLPSILLENDAFISSSTHEGFGISLAEAMALGMPCIVSDIPTFREVGGEGCIYFDLKDENSLPKLLNQLLDKKYDLEDISGKAKEISTIFHKDTYLKNLNLIYSQVEN